MQPIKTETVKHPEEPLYHGTYYNVQYEFKNYSFHSSVRGTVSICDSFEIFYGIVLP